ncbi:MAG: 2-oxoacid:acceptor oxidoreductase family protein [Anaerovoracaceae bacterium]|jgi:2-oxoglutarate ferredoxin oxidoreductase subunit gamma
MGTVRLFLAGFGGQGILLIGQMLTYAGMLEGKEVSWMPSYGPEMRGGTANCTVIISDKPIASPIITETEVLVAMNAPSLERFQPMLLPGGALFINRSLIDREVDRDDIDIHYVDGNQIARKIGSEKFANIVMLGAIVRKTGVVSLERIEEVMENMFTGSKARFLPMNKKALLEWQG